MSFGALKNVNFSKILSETQVISLFKYAQETSLTRSYIFQFHRLCQKHKLLPKMTYSTSESIYPISPEESEDAKYKEMYTLLWQKEMYKIICKFITKSVPNNKNGPNIFIMRNPQNIVTWVEETLENFFSHSEFNVNTLIEGLFFIPDCPTIDEDEEDEILDDNRVKSELFTLAKVKFRLGHLMCIVEALIKRVELGRLSRGFEKIKLLKFKYDILGKIEYLSILEWFIEVDYLPLKNRLFNQGAMEKNWLLENYSAKRNPKIDPHDDMNKMDFEMLRSVNSDMSGGKCVNEYIRPFGIDLIMKCFNVKENEIDELKFPPSTIYSLIFKLFGEPLRNIKEDISANKYNTLFINKHMLMMYFLLGYFIRNDIVNDEETSRIVLKAYTNKFNISKDHVNLVRLLWIFDNEYRCDFMSFEMSLLDIKKVSIMEYKDTFIKWFLITEKYRNALDVYEYSGCTCLILTAEIFLHNNLIKRTYYLQKSQCIDENNRRIIFFMILERLMKNKSEREEKRKRENISSTYFCDDSVEYDEFLDFFAYPLDEFELTHMVKYFKNFRNNSSWDLLHIFLVLKARHVEAVQLYNVIKSNIIRDGLKNNLIKLLPNTFEAPKLKRMLEKEPDKPFNYKVIEKKEMDRARKEYKLKKEKDLIDVKEEAEFFRKDLNNSLESVSKLYCFPREKERTKNIFSVIDLSDIRKINIRKRKSDFELHYTRRKRIKRMKEPEKKLFLHENLIDEEDVMEDDILDTGKSKKKEIQNDGGDEGDIDESEGESDDSKGDDGDVDMDDDEEEEDDSEQLIEKGIRRLRVESRRVGPFFATMPESADGNKDEPIVISSSSEE